MSKRAAEIFGSIVLLFFLSYCSKPANKIIYHKSSTVKLDATCSWLSKKANFHNKKYYSIFRKYYSKQLSSKQYEKASQALWELTEQEMHCGFYQKSTFETVLSFKKKIGNKLPWHKMLFESYIGNYHMNQSNYRKAIPYFRKIIHHEPFDYNTCIEIGYAYGDIAFCHFAIGQHEKALRNNVKALSLFNKTDNYSGRGGIYSNMSMIHLYTKDYKEAELCIDKSIVDYKHENDMNNIFVALYNKIILYEEINDPRKYDLIDSTYHLFGNSKIQDESLEVALASFYVDVLLHKKRNEEARELLSDIKPIVDELKAVASDADYIVALANYEIKSGKGIENINTIEKALEVVEEQEDYQNQLAYAEILKENALLNNDYQKAFVYSEKLKHAENMISNQKMITKTMELNKLYETKHKESQIVNQKETISNNKATIAFLISLLMGLILIGVIIFSRQKQKKIRTENQRARLYTKKLLDKTEEERKRIASDLHDSVSHELLNLKHILDGNTSSRGKKIDSIINDIRNISRNLHPVMFEKVGLSASIGQLLDRAQASNQLLVTSDINYSGFLSVSDELQVYRIVQEALTNIIKYAEAIATKISILEREDGLFIQIKDNGKGFNVMETLTGKDAFGLHNIIERSKAIGGEAKIQSDQKGTIITIDLKKL